MKRQVLNYNPSNYKKSLLETVLSSRDKDTVGTMSECSFGAHLGIDNIPREWAITLENGEKNEHLAHEIVKLKEKNSHRKVLIRAENGFSFSVFRHYLHSTRSQHFFQGMSSNSSMNFFSIGIFSIARRCSQLLVDP